jgi:DNA-binding MarR family transcriptional regulator
MSDSNGAQVDAVRRFNRFYTRLIGALDEGHLASAYSLAEVRVLYELAQRPGVSAVDLASTLSLDEGYLSRILRRFSREGLVRRTRSANDKRRTLLSLTSKGERTFAPLNAGARDHVKGLLEPLSRANRRALVRAMQRIEQILSIRGG